MIGLLIGECAGSRLVGQQARRMVYDKSEWRGFLKGNAWSVALGMILNFEEMPQMWAATAI